MTPAARPIIGIAIRMTPLDGGLYPLPHRGREPFHVQGRFPQGVGKRFAVYSRKIGTSRPPGNWRTTTWGRRDRMSTGVGERLQDLRTKSTGGREGFSKICVQKNDSRPP